MVHSCSVFGCRQRGGRDRSFYSIPSVISHQGEKARELSSRRRTAWLASIRVKRSNWRPGSGACVCSSHFVSGKPAALFDETNPDWVPTVRMGDPGHESICRSDRYIRRMKRQRRRLETSEASSSRDSGREAAEVLSEPHGQDPAAEREDASLRSEIALLQEESISLRSQIASLRQDNASLRSEITHLKSQTEAMEPDILEKNPDVLKFYTGLPNWTIFTALLTLITPALPEMPHSKLSPFQRILMFLMKIRLHLYDEDLAYRFSVHRTTVSRNFHRVLDVMAAKTSHLIKWPDRDTLRETLPSSFRRFFSKCCIIIDCTEVFIERPSDLLARAQVWSNYKHHSTMKFLIGITPQGTISYLSSCVGGRMSDKEIVERSNLIDYLLPGDVVIADRGFTCDDYAHMALAEVKTPPFTKGKKQLEKVDVDWSRELSIVRIHVE